MQLRSTTASLVAVAAVSALLVSACGGGDGGEEKGSGKGGGIEGAKDGSSRSPGRDGGSDEAASGDFRTSDIELPKDLKLVFDWEKPGDPEKAAALDGAADYVRAYMHGAVEHDLADPVVKRHTVSLESAGEFARSFANSSKERGTRPTGTQRQYREHIGDVTDGKLVEVSFCVNQAKLYAKNIKSGKVKHTEESPSSYLHFTLVMEKENPKASLWKARAFEAETKAVGKCRD